MKVMKAYSSVEGIVFNIQHFSIHDGPGIRTTVFLKGCSLRCFWCCNPESQLEAPEISRNTRRCFGVSSCGRCLESCKQEALYVFNGGIQRKRALCISCGACIDDCPRDAISLVGKRMTAGEVIDIISQDALFFAHSDGGFTLSGGEALLQADFAEALCIEGKRNGLAPCVETCAHIPYDSMLKVCRQLSYLFVDVKHIDSSAHKKATGADNELILENIRRIRKDLPSLSITLRTPVIPGFNASVEVIERIAQFAGSLGNVKYELLPYHRLGEDKYENLGKLYPASGIEPPSQEVMTALKKIAAQYVELI